MADKKSAEKTVDAPLTYDELKNMPDSEKPVSTKARRVALMIGPDGTILNPVFNTVNGDRDKNNAHRLDLLDAAYKEAVKAVKEVGDEYNGIMAQFADPNAPFKHDPAAVVGIMKEATKRSKGIGYLQKGPRTAPEGIAKMSPNSSPQFALCDNPADNRKVLRRSIQKLMDFQKQWVENVNKKSLEAAPTIKSGGETVRLMDLNAKKEDGTPVFTTQQTMQILKINAVMVTTGKLAHDYAVANKNPELAEKIANAEEKIKAYYDRFNAVRDATLKKISQLEARGYVTAEQTQDISYVKTSGMKPEYAAIYAAVFGEPTIGTPKDTGPREFEGYAKAIREYGKEHAEIKTAGSRPRKAKQAEAVAEPEVKEQAVAETAPAPEAPERSEAVVQTPTPVEEQPVVAVAEVAVVSEPEPLIDAYADIDAAAANIEYQDDYYGDGYADVDDPNLPF